MNKNMCDTNSRPEEIYQAVVKRQSVTKGNKKLRAK